MNRQPNLRNRHIIIERDFNRRAQRFEFWWDNPMGTQSHKGYTRTLVGAVIGAIHNKLSAEFHNWQQQRPVRRWTL